MAGRRELPKQEAKQRKKEFRKTHGRLEEHSLLPYVLLPGIPVILLSLFRIFRGNRAVMNFIIDHITNPYKQAVSSFADLLPFSLAEVLIVAAFAAALVYIIESVVVIIRRKGKLLRIVRRLDVLASCVIIVYTGFTLLWGINYYGTDFAEQAGLQRRGATAEELYQLTAAFIDKANELSDQVERDENGSFCVDTETILNSTDGIFDGILEEYPFLDGPEHRVKGVNASIVMDYVSYTGFYFPFTGEANVNIDPPSCLLPVTVVHELTHQRGVTDEDEANFAAIMTCLRSDDPVYQYSGCLLAYIHLGNALYKADKELWTEAHDRMSADVYQDMLDNNAFWASFQQTKAGSAAKNTADKVYSAFTESYGEEDVMQRYEACVELLVAYYFDN